METMNLRILFGKTMSNQINDKIAYQECIKVIIVVQLLTN